IHSHSDFQLLLDGRAMSKVMQGVTTEVVGNCGMSPHPAPERVRRQLAEALGYAGFVEEVWDFETTGEYIARLEGRVSLNVVVLVGHGALRAAAVGFEARKASAEEISEMRRLLGRSLDEGAAGLSAGLIYPPSSYADVRELTALAQVAADRGGLFSCHIRSEGDRLFEALEEMAEVARGSGVFVEVSHLKCSGRRNWGRAGEALEWFEGKVREGLRIGYDAYPYEAGSTHLSAYLPDWVHDAGPEEMIRRLNDPGTRARVIEELKKRRGWEPDDLMLAHLERNRDLMGLRLSEAAKKRGVDPEELLVRLVAEEGGRALVISFSMSQEDVDRIVCGRLGAIGSDGSAISPDGPLGGSPIHPRNYGAFPRVIKRYVKELKLLTIEEAIRKMTSLPASRIGLRDRGVIKAGAKADLVVFDLDELEDRATYSDPHRFPKGIKWVIVNGRAVVVEGEHTGESPGRVLRPRR
ncbi:aminoacylase, partial [Candidatus Poribacteria bacterium]